MPPRMKDPAEADLTRERFGYGVSGGVRVNPSAQVFPDRPLTAPAQVPSSSAGGTAGPIPQPCPLCSQPDAGLAVYHHMGPCPREGWPPGIGTLRPTVTQRADHLLAHWSISHPGAARALADASGLAWTALRDAIAWALETRP